MYEVTIFIPIDQLSTLVRDWSSTLARWCTGSARFIDADDPQFTEKVVATMLACHMLEHRFWCIERDMPPPKKIIEPQFGEEFNGLTGYSLTYEFANAEDARIFEAYWRH